MRKNLSVLLVLIMLLSVLTLPCTAAQTKAADITETTKNIVNTVDVSGKDYDIYLSEKPELSYFEEMAAAELEGSFPEMLEPEKTMNMTVSVAADGWYEFYLVYTFVGSGELAVNMSIDGKAPFSEAEKLSFPSYWVNSGSTRYDNNGNQIAPEQVLYDGEVRVAARDYIGIEENPYRFYLTVGTHNVSLRVLYGKVELKSASFIPVTKVTSYNEYLKENQAKKFSSDPIIIQGEEAVIKNSRSLIPLSDKRNADMSPADAVKGKLNYIGGTNWKNTGDTITWEVEVEKTGYYRMGTRYRQSEVVGSPSYRELKIDGKIPFIEAQSIKYTYTSDWKYTEFENNGVPYLFYLTEGKHTVSLSVIGGDMIAVYKELHDITASLGELYVDITMIIGETVDVQRSYELFNQIPNFNERLEENINALSSLAKRIEKLQESTSGTTVSIIDSAVQTLTLMLEKPYSAHKYKSSYYTAYTNLSAQMGSMLNMPLDIDQICFIADGNEYKTEKVSFFKRLGFSFSRFFSSFVNDYKTADENEDESITIWVNWGRDQAQALNNSILNSFVPKYKISVNVKVVNATLVQAILSGRGPDCMLQMLRSEPVNLAMRGGLIDLSGFEGFDETLALFRNGATKPYEYRGGTYALPDTQNFNMMFARTDILEELGIKIPETWNEFIDAITILQRSNLQVCMPQTLSPTMLVQKGLSYYNDELNGTALADAESIAALINYTDYFTEYKVPKAMDFYNRFRIGSAPLGISVYTLGTQLQAAAPEIDGCWEMYPIPGTVDEKGNINYTSAGDGTGCGITKLSKNKEAAWKFLKWWVSKDTQIAFSNELETVLGPLGRVAVSNTEALSEMGWEPSKLTQINKQWTAVEEMPQIAGSYYVDRSITQIFWNVVEMNENPKDTIIKWAAIADSEIARKQQEYENR